MHDVLPAIEALHAAWSSRVSKPKYSVFIASLTAGAEMLDKYYKKTADSDAHILAMCTLTYSIPLMLYD